MSFKIGDKVIYPNHGLGIVSKIEEKTIFGNAEFFFLLRILSTESTVLVPVANVDNVGLRRAISDEEVEELYRLLGDGHIDNHQNWKGRFKDNSDKMRTGSIYDMADVLKSLTFLAKSKSLSFREKRMLDRAKSLIVSEISEVMRIKPEAVEARVNEQLEKCFAERARAVAAGEPLPPPRIIPPAPPRSAMPVPGVKPMAAAPAPAAHPITPLQARVAEKAAQPAAVAVGAVTAPVAAAKTTAGKTSSRPVTPSSKAPKTAAAVTKSPAKSAAAKKPVAKKVVAKKPVAKKPVAKKPVAKKPVAKKPVAKKPVAKKPVAKKPVAKKTVAKKPVAKKTVAKKTVAKKTVAKKPVAKKVAAKKKAAKKKAPARARR